LLNAFTIVLKLAVKIHRAVRIYPCGEVGKRIPPRSPMPLP
jgi:hypothetical protein